MRRWKGGECPSVLRPLLPDTALVRQTKLSSFAQFSQNTMSGRHRSALPKRMGAPGPSRLGTWDTANPSQTQIGPGKRRVPHPCGVFCRMDGITQNPKSPPRARSAIQQIPGHHDAAILRPNPTLDLLLLSQSHDRDSNEPQRILPRSRLLGSDLVSMSGLAI